MNFLPIVTRELRVASRKRGTYWVRCSTAAVSMLIALLLLIMVNISGPTVGGSRLFVTLSYYTFALCLLSGVFLTADCLSEEKREGTLGLFFLTDLKGYDVVLGKMLATSLNAVYALLALMPVLALPLLIGGVTGGEFWRTTAALVNAMFFSLAVGIWVSAGMDDSQRAMGATFGVVGLFVIGLPLLRELFEAMQVRSLVAFASSNPFTTLQLASEKMYIANPRNFLVSLAGSHVVAWLLVGAASVLLPRTWQQRAKPDNGLLKKTSKLLGRGPGIKDRARLLDRNPILWLMSGSRGLSSVVWLLALIPAVIFVLFSIFGSADFGVASGWFSWPALFLLKMLIAFRATLFFTEARKSGAMELLVATPLSNREVVHGQFLALQRIFAAPITLVLIGLLAPAVWSLHVGAEGLLMSGFAIYGAIAFLMSAFAVAWFGMWMALTCRKPALATAWTVLFAVFLPNVVFCVPNLLIDVGLIVWSRNRLVSDFRNLAAAPVP